MEVRFKCTCYIILQALGSCHQCFYGVSASAASAMHYTLRMHGLYYMEIQHQPLASLVPRPLFSVFICGGGKKGLVDLRRNFRSTRPTDFGGR